VLEIGSYCGKSTIYLAAAARAAGQLVSQSTITAARRSTSPAGSTTIPLWSTADRRLDTLPALRATLAAAGLEDHVVVVVGRSADVAALAHAAGPGVHRRRAHRAGGDDGLPGLGRWVAPGGALAIHDVFPDPADGGGRRT